MAGRLVVNHLELFRSAASDEAEVARCRLSRPSPTEPDHRGSPAENSQTYHPDAGPGASEVRHQGKAVDHHSGQSVSASDSRSIVAETGPNILLQSAAATR